MKKIPEYIVLQSLTMKCLRCGAERELSLPAPVDDFVLQADGFAEWHKFCKEGKKGESIHTIL